jgi:glycosyltransferase involved in cell wall biosynthesis
MRICLYTETALPLVGGQEIAIDQLARNFLGLGHEVVVLAARHRGRAVYLDHELPYRVVRHPRFISTHRMVGWYRRYVDRLRQTFPFDILHCHSVQPTGYVAACCRNQTGLRVVLTSQGGDLSPEDEFLRKPGALARSKIALERADAAIAISDFVLQRLHAVAPDSQPIERIPNGVDWSRFASPVVRPADIDRRIVPGGYFLFLGRIVHRKGVDLVLHAFQQASAQLSTRLVIAGDGIEFESMRQLACQLGISARTHFVGCVKGDNKSWLLQNAIATVMPSRVWEGLPLVALESFAAGRPVIANETPGLQELILPKRTGWLVTPESPRRLATALLDAAHDVAITNRLGEASREFAKQYDWAVLARRHCDLFEKLLLKNNPAHDRRQAA